MRTIIYIDGFNFHYGCMKSTDYRWLDLKKFFEAILDTIPPPKCELVSIKYFTAPPLKDRTRELQNVYFGALEAHTPEFNFYDGFFHEREQKMPKVKFPNEEVLVKRTEEKQSDVNLATEMLNDAWLNRYDCAILVSGDSDMAPAIRHIKQNSSRGALPRKKIGVIVPAYKRKGTVYAEGLKKEKPDFIRVIAPDKIRGIDDAKISGVDVDTEELLKNCQLPNILLHKQSGILIEKPQAWYDDY